MSNSEYQVGLYETRPISSAPMDVVALLRSRAEVSKADIAEMFMDLNVQTLAFDGHKFDPAAGTQEALADCIAKSMTLTELSFKNVKSTPEFDVVGVCTAAFVENLSVQRLDLSDCQLTTAQAQQLSENVVPWNHTIVDWDLSGNTLLGDDGVSAFLNALLASTSSIQRLSLRRTGITDVNKVAKLLEGLPCLFQVDVSENGGPPLSQAVAADLLSVLEKNLTLLHPHAKTKLAPLVAPPSPPPAEAAKSPSEEKDKTSPEAEEKKPAPARQRAASTKQQAPPARSRSDSRASKSTPSNGSFAQPKEHPPQQQHSSNPPPPKEQAAPRKEQHADPAQGTQSEASAPATEPKTASEAKPSQQQQPAPDKKEAKPQAKPSPARGRSPSARPASPARTYTRSVSQTQKDINDGVDEWKKIRNQYNQYIRAASPAGTTASQSERKGPAPPKFVLGKRVEDRPIPSAVFKSGPTRTRERMPTPSEIRRLAPWNQQQPATAVGQVSRVELPERTGVTKQPIVLTFVDGGRQTYIEEDPRDLGYVARKIQTGQIKPSGTLYRSNTPRDLRFGVDYTDKTYVHRSAQAPAPGTYVVESEWEKRARLLRERARAVSGTGRPMFGSSGAPREAFASTKKDLSRPGPGEYEIP